MILLPSEKALLRKKKQVADLSEEFNEALVGILADYKGISVSQDTELRKNLRESGVTYKVLKNNIIRRSLEMSGINGLESFLTGTNVVAIDKSSYSNAAKIICDFAKKNDFYKIKVGFVEGKILDFEGIKSLSKLPSREQLVAQMLCGMNAPISGFARALNGIIRSLAVVLSEICKQKS